MSTTPATVLHAISDFERGREAWRAKPTAVCRFTFTYTDTSVGPVTISKGEHVDPSHECIAARPDAFGIVHGKRKRSRRPELNAAAAAKAARDRDDPPLPGPSWSLGLGRGLLAGAPVERRAATSPVKVRISRRTRDNIADACAAVPRSHETGGMLIANRSHDSSTVDLCEAWCPGPASELRRGSIALDWATEHSRARDLMRSTEHALILAGVWHVHPMGSANPSDGDLRMFSAAMRHADANVWPLRSYVGLIATSVGRIGGPDLTAWVTREHYGRLVCERAVIA